VAAREERPDNERKNPKAAELRNSCEALRYRSENPTLRAFFQLALQEQRGREGWGTRKSDAKAKAGPSHQSPTAGDWVRDDNISEWGRPASQEPLMLVT